MRFNSQCARRRSRGCPEEHFGPQLPGGSRRGGGWQRLPLSSACSVERQATGTPRRRPGARSSAAFSPGSPRMAAGATGERGAAPPSQALRLSALGCGALNPKPAPLPLPADPIRNSPNR